MKDYANRSFEFSDNKQQHKVPIPWGFIIAALIAMLVIYSIWHRVQQKSLALHPVVATTAVAPSAVNKVQSVPVANTTAASATKGTTAPPVKFDFYQMLTDSPSNAAKGAAVNARSAATQATASTMQSQSSTQATDDSQAETQSSTDSRYYLQVGNHRTKADALQQKANLILSEVSPKLIKVLGSSGHYRVMIGPYSSLESATAEKSDLRQNGINVSLVKDLKK